MRGAAAGLAVVLAWLSVAPQTAPVRPIDPAPLRQVAGLQRDDFARLAEGRTVARTLEGTDDREVAAIGAITLPVSRQTFVEALRDLAAFKRGAAVPHIGRFGTPPAIADLEALPVDTDLRDLRECRVDRCKVQAPRPLVDAVQRELAPNPKGVADARLAALFKAFLVRRATDYLAGGRAALEPYAQRPGVTPSADLDGLLAASAPYAKLSPAVFDFLRAFPAGAAEAAARGDVQSSLYWAHETFGWKPVTTLTHWVVGPAAPPPGQPIVGASLQLYASHYIDASLGLTLVFEPANADAARRSCHVVYINRSRAKATTGMFGGVARRLIESRTRDGLRRHLDALATRFAGRPAAG